MFSTAIVYLAAQSYPLLVSQLVDWAIPSKSVIAILAVVGGLLISPVIRNIADVLAANVATRTGMRIAADMQLRIIRHLLSVDLRFLHRQRVGDLIARANDDVRVIQEFLTGTLVDIFSYVLAATISMAVIAFFNWKLALAIVVFLPFLPIPVRLMRNYLRSASTNRREANGANVAFLQETLSSILPIQASEAENQVEAQQQDITKTLVAASVRLRLAQSIAAYTADSVGYLISIVLVFGFGAFLVINGELTVGQLIATQYYAANLVFPITALSRIGTLVPEVLASVDRENELFAMPVRTGARLTLPIDASGDLQIKDVSFSYSNEASALQRISLSVPHGASIAIVGPSGAGKSTLGYLISGIMPPTTGYVRLDNIDIYMLANRSDHIALVPQEPFLFHDTIEANIRFGCKALDMREVKTAARLARIDEVIEALPQGYNTVIGDKGVMLSGGERQRITLARAFLRKPGILVLDEVTSALDTATERAVLGSLHELQSKITLILITHRISSAMLADEVYVLDNGCIAEHGKPESILEQQGLFYKLYMAQNTLDHFA